MKRKLTSLVFVLGTMLQAGAAFAQSPPICPQGTWASRTASGWVCSRSETTSDSSSSSSTPQKKGGRGGGGMGGGRGMGGSFDGIPR